MNYLTLFDNDPFFKTVNDIFKEDDFITKPFNYGRLPITDIIETDDEFQINMELAGYSKKDISINIEDDVLTITGEREQIDESTKFIRRESSTSKFKRSFNLDGYIINYDEIESSFKHGILTINLPKKEEEKTKSISIKIS